MGQDVVLATICARAGSKGVPGKNLLTLAGRPLIAYSIECAQKCPEVDRIIVSTDSPEIAGIAEESGVSVPFLRPAELATDESAKIDTIRHATEWAEAHWDLQPTLVVDLDITTPLRSPEDVSGCIGLFGEPSFDAVVTAYPAERNPYFNMVEIAAGNQARLVKEAPQGLTRRQDAPVVHSVTGSVFAWRRSSLDHVTHLFEGSWGAFEVPRSRGIDIDDPVDLMLIEVLLEKTAGTRSLATS